jgi:hemoglobin-like flavoprotein
MTTIKNQIKLFIYFLRIFLEHKELKHLWKFAKNLETEDQMNSNQMLKAHGEKLFNGIDMAVNSLDDLNTLVPILIQLGYSHGSWGVKEEHFPVL